VKPDLRHRLRLAGRFTEPAEERWSLTLARELGVESEIEITGERPHDEVLASLASLHVYVQCSAFEGLPNAMLEAAACGVPLVATGVGGMQEVLRGGENAMVVAHGDPRALGRAVERVLADDELALRLPEAASRLRKSCRWIASRARGSSFTTGCWRVESPRRAQPKKRLSS
jgi:Glycosyltransferase